MNAIPFSRRHILRALGLAGGASLLPSLRPRNLWSQSIAIPPRIVFFYTFHGGVRNMWLPRGVGGAAAPTETAWSLSPDIHSSLIGREKKLIFLDGLDMVSADLQNNKPQPENAHIAGQTHSLTGITQATAALAGGISIDQRIVKDLGPVTFRPSINMEVFSPDTADPSPIQSTASGLQLPRDAWPTDTYNYLFPMGPPMSGPATVVDQSVAQQKSVLDWVANEITSVRPKLAAADKIKLDAHATAIRDLESRLKLSGGGSTRTCMPLSKTQLGAVAKNPPSGGDNNEGEGPGFEQWFDGTADLFMRLIQTAFSCDLSRVATLVLGQFPDVVTGYTPSGVSGTKAYPASFKNANILDLHHVVHAFDKGDGHDLSTDPDATSIIKSYHNYGASQFAKLLGYLDAIPEADGQTTLDHTVVLYCGEIATGDHDLHRLPWIMAGSAGGYFRTGRYINFPRTGMNGNGPPHNNLFVSLANAMGSPITTFGNPACCTGPISLLR